MVGIKRSSDALYLMKKATVLLGTKCGRTTHWGVWVESSDGCIRQIWLLKGAPQPGELPGSAI